MLQNIIELGSYPNIMKCNKYSIACNNDYQTPQQNVEFKKINIIYKLIEGRIHIKILDVGSDNNNEKPTLLNLNHAIERANNYANNKLPDFLLHENIKFGSNRLLSFSSSEISDKNIREIILTSHNYYCVEYPANDILNEIFLSYGSQQDNTIFKNKIQQKILNQVLLDFPRMRVCFNDAECLTTNVFIKLLSRFENFHHDLTGSLQNLILMLCTQASFFYPFNMIHEIYNLPDTDIFIISKHDHPYINLIENKNGVTLYFKKIFKCVNVNDENTPIINFHTIMTTTIENINKNAICGNFKIYWYKNCNIITI